MKKVLSTVAALGLVAGLASTAAAVEFKMSGKYMVEGAYLSDSRGAGVVTTEAATVSNPTDAYWLHTFEIKPTMKVNDKVSMSSVIRLADDSIWGSQTAGDVNSTGTKVGGTTGDVYVHQLYMDYASPIGNVRLGRTPAGTYGTNFMDFDKRANRVMWYPSFLTDGPWSTLLYMEKGTDQQTMAASSATYQSDKDSTKLVARVYYKNDSLDSGIHYAYGRNMTEATKFLDVSTPSIKDVKDELTVYGKYKMDNYFANAELTHYFGKVDWTTSTHNDYDSWAGMLQVGGKFDALTPSLMYFYAQGQDRTSTDLEAALVGSTVAGSGTGDQFEPLYILTGRNTGMLNTDIFSGNTGNLATAGVHAIVAAADYAVSNQLTLHGAIGWAKADEKVTSAGTATLDDSYGWEYNLGAAYKLLDNLTYEAHFGYLATGDYFNGNSTTDITKNVYILTHSLTMSF